MRKWSIFNLLGVVAILLLAACGNQAPPLQNPDTFQVNASAVQNGLTGEYFDNIDLTGTKKTQGDGIVDKTWGTNPPLTGMGNTTYSVRWTGQIQPLYTETYTFYVTHTDGARLMVNGAVVVNNWKDQAQVIDSNSITLQANTLYDIRLEYYRNATNPGKVKLEWQSPSQARQVVPRERMFASGSNLQNAINVVKNFQPFKNLGATLDEQNAYGSLTGAQFSFVVQELGKPSYFVAAVAGSDIRMLQYHTLSGQNLTVKNVISGKTVNLGDINQYYNADGTQTQAQKDLYAQRTQPMYIDAPDWAINALSSSSSGVSAMASRCNVDPNEPKVRKLKTALIAAGIEVGGTVVPAGWAAATGKALLVVIYSALPGAATTSVLVYIGEDSITTLRPVIDDYFGYLRNVCIGVYDGPTGQSELNLTASLGQTVISKGMFIKNTSTDVGLIEVRATAGKGILNATYLTSGGAVADITGKDILPRLWPQDQATLTYRFTCPNELQAQPIEDQIIITHNDSSKVSANIKVNITCVGVDLAYFDYGPTSFYAYSKIKASDPTYSYNYQEGSIFFYAKGNTTMKYTAIVTPPPPVGGPERFELEFVGPTTLDPWQTGQIKYKATCGDTAVNRTMTIGIAFTDTGGRSLGNKFVQIPWVCNKVTLAVSMIGSPYNGPLQDCPRVKAKITLKSTVPIPNFTPDWIGIRLTGWGANAGDWNNGPNAQDWQRVARRELTKSGDDYYFTGTRSCNFYQGANLPFRVDLRIDKRYDKIVATASTTFKVEDNRWPGVVIYSHLGGPGNYVFDWNAYWTPPEARDPNWPKYGENLDPLTDRQKYSISVPKNGFKVLMRGEVSYISIVTLNGYRDKPWVDSIVMRMPIDDDPVVRYGVNSYFVLVVAGNECPTLQNISLRMPNSWDSNPYSCIKTSPPLVPNGWLKNWPWWIR